MPRPRKIRLRVGKAMRFADMPNERPGWEQIAATLQETVQELAIRS